MSRKYLAEFVTRMVQHNKLNYLRYHVALGLIDEKGEGRVSYIEAYKTISEKLGLNTRTVRRTLNDMVKYEWLDSGPNHFYYRKQERIALRYDCELTSRRSVAYSWEDVSGDIVHWRSVTMDAVLAIHGDNPTITREKLHELYGWSRQTQRKYNRIAGTGTRENYAALSQMESEYDLQRAQELRPYAFMFNDANGELFTRFWRRAEGATSVDQSTLMAQLFLDDGRVHVVLQLALWLPYPMIRLAWFFCYLDQRIRNECWDLQEQFRAEAARLEQLA